MSVITYTAIDRGELASGHSELTEYSIETGFNNFQRSNNRVATPAVSLSGNSRETTFSRVDVTYNVSTVPENDATKLEELREFISSILAGEQFTIDLNGTTVTPDNPIAYKLVGDPSENIAEISGFYSFSFQVVRV